MWVRKPTYKKWWLDFQGNIIKYLSISPSPKKGATTLPGKKPSGLQVFSLGKH